MKTTRMIGKKVKKVAGKTIIVGALAILVGGLSALPASADNFRRSAPHDRDRYESRDRDRDTYYNRHDSRDRDRDAYYHRSVNRIHYSRGSVYEHPSVVVKLPPPPGLNILFPHLNFH